MIKKGLVVFFTFLYFFGFGQDFEQTGKCSYYADKFNGRNTSSGEKYNKNLFTAAHRTLPYNTVIMVTNLRNQKKVLVKINDRGPHTKGRILDLSGAAARELDMLLSGVENVKLEVVEVPPSYLKQDTIGMDEPEKKVKQVDEPETKVSPAIAKTSTSVNETKNNAIYDDKHQPANPQGYGVQAGYFKNLNNCKNYLQRLQTDYKVPGYFFVEKKTKNTYYRLIMGAYESKKQATDLQSKLRNEIPGCHIINWKSL